MGTIGTLGMTGTLAPQRASLTGAAAGLLPAATLSDFERRAAAASPAGLAWVVTRGEWQMADHLTVLDEKLLDLAAGRIKRLMVFMPPRSGKSELCSRFFPAWYVARHQKRLILASYEATFASYWGQQAREIVREYGPSVFGVSLSWQLQQQRWWAIQGLETKASMMTAGVGGALTGKGADLLALDDPVKNAAEADSPVIREGMWRWYTSTFRTRLQPGGGILIIQTRWHDDDMAGRLLKLMETGDGEEWTVLSLPAIAVADEVHPRRGMAPWTRRAGEALWPSRFSVEQLQEVKVLDPRTWAALYQQNPVPETGTIFQRAWFEARYRSLDQLRGARTMRVVQAIDTAFKEGVSNDYSVIATWGATETDYVLLDLVRVRVDYPTLRRTVQDAAAKWNPDAILIEDAASGQSLIQELRRTTALPIIPVRPDGSKQARAAAVSPAFEAGRVLLPESAPWLSDWIEEHIRFPMAVHDDMVDTTSMALAYLRRGRGQIAFALTGTNGSTGGVAAPGTGAAPARDHGAIAMARGGGGGLGAADLPAAIVARLLAPPSEGAREGAGDELAGPSAQHALDAREREISGTAGGTAGTPGEGATDRGATDPGSAERAAHQQRLANLLSLLGQLGPPD